MDPDTRHVERAVADAMTLLGEGRRLTIAVNDPQRHTDSRAVLSVLADHVSARDVRILVATGSHAFGSEQRDAFERALVAGPGFDRIAWHDCRSPDLRPVAPGAWRGHPWLAGATDLLAIGSVEPHYFAGLTGAHKTVTIGCASHEDIQRNHQAAVADNCLPGRLAGSGVFDGVREMLTALADGRRVAAINLVQRGRRILAAAGGEPVQTLHRLSGVVEETFIRRIAAPAYAVIAEVSGPLAGSFYQADKGIKNCEHAVRDGGLIILVADCPDGIGQGSFTELLHRGATHDEVAGAVAARGYRLGDHKAVRLRRLTDPARRGVRVCIVSEGISAGDAALLGLTKSPSVEHALSDANISTDTNTVIRLADAGNTCLLLGDR